MKDLKPVKDNHTQLSHMTGFLCICSEIWYKGSRTLYQLCYAFHPSGGLTLKKPLYNDYFPLIEYEQRLQAVRTAMQRAGFAALLLSTEPNIVYTSGFLNGAWANGFHLGSQFVLIAASSQIEPVLIVPAALKGSLMTSAFSETRALDQPAGPQGIACIAALLEDWNVATKKSRPGKRPFDLSGSIIRLRTESEAGFAPGEVFVDCPLA